MTCYMVLYSKLDLEENATISNLPSVKLRIIWIHLISASSEIMGHPLLNCSQIHNINSSPPSNDRKVMMSVRKKQQQGLLK